MFRAVAETQRIRLPMVPGNRSPNLSNTVAVGLYEAWRLQVVLREAAAESLLLGKVVGIV